MLQTAQIFSDAIVITNISNHEKLIVTKYIANLVQKCVGHFIIIMKHPS